MARLTRAESQAQTRAQLLATAKEMFFRDGFAATSLDKVAESAGYSKGAVYSNFRNKDELCQAVLADIRAERTAEILAILDAGDMRATVDQLQIWANRVVGDPEWTTLELEYAIQARRNERLRTDLAAQQASILDLVAGAAATVDDLQPRLPLREFVTAGLAVGIGLGLMRSIDPNVPVDGLVDTIRILAGMPAAE